MKKISEKRQNNFIHSVIKFMNSLQAEVLKPELDIYIAQWNIITRIGLLKVTLEKQHEHVFTIFCRFSHLDEPKYSKFNSFRVNKFSGKWNFHYSNEKECLDTFKTELNAIVIDQYKTDVVFRKFSDGDIIAIMPHEVCDHSGNVTSYMHVGQHSGADYGHIIRSTKLATYEEYVNLLNELQDCFGYNFNIIKRQTHSKFITDYRRVRGV